MLAELAGQAHRVPLGIAHARLHATPEQLVDLWSHVEAVQAPTLLLRGTQSDFLSAQIAQEMVGRNPRIRSVDVPQASRYVHDDNLPAFERFASCALRDVFVGNDV